MESVIEKKNKVTFNNIFILFFIGSILGVLIEGMYCLFKKGHWESHVVSMLGLFNILYGLGAVVFYVGACKMEDKKLPVKVLIMTFLVTILELLCGLLLREALGMRAWNYHNRFLNYQGLICPEFSLGWGIVAFVFCLISPFINKSLEKFNTKSWKYLFIILSIIMSLDLLFTASSIVRWSRRHDGIEAQTKLGEVLDKKANDEVMKNRFVEWKFIER